MHLTNELIQMMLFTDFQNYFQKLYARSCTLAMLGRKDDFCCSLLQLMIAMMFSEHMNNPSVVQTHPQPCD